APIDGFGVGAHMATSSDAPVLDTAYKLVEYAGRPKLKLSESKSTLPGRKQILRQKTSGKAVRDVIGLRSEELSGEPLLIPVMSKGRRIQPAEPLDICRNRCCAELKSLPDELLSLSKADAPYPVELSAGLERLRIAATNLT
ncbi:MAG: nicotinate phosphoribosyltransferase, partial [Acidobacteria bacterium]